MSYLYHFTSHEAFGKILFDGAIQGTDLRINKNRDRIGLCGVWLTKKPDLTISHGLPDLKRQVRIKVDVPDRDVKRWQSWARGRGIKQEHISAMAAPGGQSWRISTLNVSTDRFVEVIDTSTGQVIASREFLDALPEIAALAYSGLDHVEQLFEAMGDEFDPDCMKKLRPGVPLNRSQILCYATGYAEGGPMPIDREILFSYATKHLP